MRFALGCLLAALAISAPLASAGPEKRLPQHISWVGKRHRYGWAFSKGASKAGWCPSRHAAPRLCTTEDGGKHWRGILYGDLDRVMMVSRSSPKAGMFVAWHGDMRYAVATLDNGRHWYEDNEIFRDDFFDRIWSKQRRIYWADGPNVYRLSGWPTKARATCDNGFWASGIHAHGPVRNVCWSDDYGGYATGTIRGVHSVLIRAPDTSISSWADSKHGFATDPAGPKWRCAPPGARDSFATLCGTNNGGKSWWISFSQEWRLKALDSLVAIRSVWRGPAKDGAFALLGESDGYGGDTVYVTHDGGGSWEPDDVFFDGMRNVCGDGEPPGTLCAGGVHFHQDHNAPLQLVYDLNVCVAPLPSSSPCQTVTYRMDGWPDGPLKPVRISP